MNSDVLISPTTTIESTHPAVIDFAVRHAADLTSEAERAVSLFYAVRDGFRYDPYQIDLSIEGMKATTTLRHGYGWCVSKAVLLAAACRALQIPAFRFRRCEEPSINRTDASAHAY